jgi:UDP-N-acetylglucosamine pyrophosphorylase
MSEKGVLLASEGSASFLTQLMKKDIDVLSTWQSSGIKYLNVVDLNNLNAKIIDPLSLGLMVERGYNCLSDVYERPESEFKQGINFNHPCVLENKFHFMDLYQPFEMARAS